MKTTRTFRVMLSLITVGLVAGNTFAQMNTDNYSEDFEYTPGTAVSNLTGSTWSATETNSVIVSTNYTASYQGVSYPLAYDHTTSTGVLQIENGVTNTILAGGTPNITNWVDVVIRPVIADDTPELPTAGTMAAVWFNTNMHPVILHSPSNDANYAEWLEIPDVTITEGDWIRLTIKVNMNTPFADPTFMYFNGTSFHKIYINGTAITNAAAYDNPWRDPATTGGEWFGSFAPQTKSAISNVIVKGTGFIDDLVVTNDLQLTAATTWTIDASAGAGGSISPSGSVVVTEGNDKTFTITPDSGYSISDVVVGEGGVTNSKGAVASYTFTNVVANGSITASFVAATVTWTINASAGTGGSITPAGSVTVTNGNDQAFTITPESHYSIGDVVVVEGGTTNTYAGTNSYTFVNVTTNGSIDAQFVMNTTSNGTPTTWYDQFGLTPADAGGTTWDDLDAYDTDGDGVLNWKEYIAGTVPTNAVSVFKILGATVDGSGNVTLQWYGGTNGPMPAPYVVEAATSLGGAPIGWAEMTNTNARVEGTNSWNGTGMGGMQFFRVLATP